MQSRFIAIPVNQGDAFFYQDDCVSVLVDGGRSRSIQAIESQIEKATPPSKLDVLICTHNDADHANGVLGVIESGIPCHEVWLPGRWTERLEELLVDPQRFFHELYSDWHDIPNEYREVGSLDELGDRLSRKVRRDEASGNDKYANGDNNSILAALESASEADIPSLPEKFCFELGIYLSFPYRHKYLRFPYRRHKVLIDAVEAALRIREIALAAFHAGASLRWFEFGATTLSPQRSITPVNCREIFHIRRDVPGALDFLALSKANRESLVFSIQPTDKRPGVIFSADSDFDFSLDNLSSGDYLITAPHHGSESNANAYTKLQRFQGTFVRSDGRYKSRPGRSFLSLSNRYCTLCRDSNLPKQAVKFTKQATGPNVWNAISTVHTCQCK